jgi:chaperonin cofactor prefoldin
LDVKAKLEERLETFAKETAFLKKKADDYSNELRDLILKVRKY